VGDLLVLLDRFSLSFSENLVHDTEKRSPTPSFRRRKPPIPLGRGGGEEELFKMGRLSAPTQLSQPARKTLKVVALLLWDERNTVATVDVLTFHREERSLA
jgi:hypothetical protein